MEIRAIKPKIEFLSFIEKHLNYVVISQMSFDNYKSLVVDLFNKLDKLRNLGVDKNEIKHFINKHFSVVMQYADDSDVLFERRFSAITEEIVEFCASPFFWDTDYEIYMRKWDRLFEIDWFKSV